jgi:predicted DNA-binding transcriptional regulator AlpA
MNRPDVERLIQALVDALACPEGGAPQTQVITITPGWTPERFELAPNPVRLSVSDLADAMQVSRKTIYRWLKNAGLPSITRDGAPLFKVGAVKAWRAARERTN